ncbi:MAG TPA: hypothetical protein VLC92_15950 [Rhodocyclaceae bacterium]|nr:hypothetical protein [Rhodocyclaceae bacterium]
MKWIEHQKGDGEEPKQRRDYDAQKAKSNPTQGVIHYARGNIQQESLTIDVTEIFLYFSV